MPYDLRTESWIPWKRLDTSIEWGSPALLVDRIADNPVVAIAAPRPDFDGAVQEFLIGLLAAALLPLDDDAWVALWNSPPTPPQLTEALVKLPAAFNLDGDGPRFFQDLVAPDFNDVDPAPIEQLLIDAPGAQTTRLNKDLFVKRGRIDRLGRPAAAMALLTLQTYAPSGGQGHRTSLRGGGPLSTLIDPRVTPQRPLWEKLWMNVETVEQWRHRTAAKPSSLDGAFPWLVPTRVSDPKGGVKTTPNDAHPLQAYFGLPRRIRLEFGEVGSCDLTGARDEQVVTAFRIRNYGVQYDGWRHPLSPYYRKATDQPWLPVHAQAGGVGWREWVGLALDSPEGALREPARAVSAFYKRADYIPHANTQDRRVHAFGYDMDNMKARGWTESIYPVFVGLGTAERRQLADVARQFVDAAGIAATAILGAVKTAFFQRPADAPGDLSQIRTEFWQATEDDAFALIQRVADSAVGEVLLPLSQEFARSLQTQALAIFERWCPSDGVPPEVMRRLVTGRYNLVMTCRGYSKLGQKLFDALRIPLPQATRGPKPPRRSAKRSTFTEARP